MSLTLLIVFITAVMAGLGFWFYNRRQINSLTETIEDKNAVINSFREHLAPSVEDIVPVRSFEKTIPVKFNPDSEVIIDARPEKKKKRYNNRPKKSAVSVEPKQQQQKQNSEKKNRPNKPRKPKTQQ